MRFKKFIIENYKAINNAIEIDLVKNNLIPIIGVNECGKTTILNAIFSFDKINDTYNEVIRHVSDVHNLYDTNILDARVSAIIEFDKKQFSKHVENYIEKYYKDLNQLRPKNKRYKIDAQLQNIGEFKLTRVFSSPEKSQYEISPKELLKGIPDSTNFPSKLILNLPYILYFDDFRDSFPDKLEINDNKSHWLDVIEELFNQTDPKYSVYNLSTSEKRHRNNILADVQKKLNDTLTKEWTNFKLDNREALEIKIDFDTDEITKKNYLSFEIIESNKEGKERNFYIRDRSKGFYWFFNFVMKVEFNPKVTGDPRNTIYLLDEPGSYLHPFAQNKLCKKLLDISKNNKVIFCTHTHYLLDPEIIPLNTIHISSKNDFGKISLEKCNAYSNQGRGMQSAFQPIFDALYLKPFSLDFTYKKMLLVEGIYDYYAFSLFKPNNDFGIIPGKNADSLINLISVMIGFNIDFKVIWDKDEEGEKKFNKAREYFGDELAANHFFLLSKNTNSNTIIQNLFSGDDIRLIKNTLLISNNSSFEKTISCLYYSDKRKEVLDQISIKTKENFLEVFKRLTLI